MTRSCHPRFFVVFQDMVTPHPLNTRVSHANANRVPSQVPCGWVTKKRPFFFPDLTYRVFLTQKTIVESGSEGNQIILLRIKINLERWFRMEEFFKTWQFQDKTQLMSDGSGMDRAEPSRISGNSQI